MFHATTAFRHSDIAAGVFARNRVAYKTQMDIEANGGETGRRERPAGELRRGWTTGACAAAAAKAAMHALATRNFPDPVSIRLPKGEEPSFALALEELGDGYARAGIIKDAGDDPDVTHGATVIATLRLRPAGSGIVFRAGAGVGTVTKPGLPLPVGEPAINPVPRQLIRREIDEICAAHGIPADVEVTISVPGGEELALKTWNPRLGIVGGISILGTTGVVHPFSCSAWIHSIWRGVDVCRANGVRHALAATGSTSEAAAMRLHDFPGHALLDMGDFAGALLKYLRDHPLERLTIAGGFAKMTKLAQGAMDLHSGRSQVDLAWLAALAREDGATEETADRIKVANTAMEALEIAAQSGLDLPARIAALSREAAMRIVGQTPPQIETVIVSRSGEVLARAGEFRD
jgi:cobalt-precorrin-5B (C1)-methyltransferase